MHEGQRDQGLHFQPDAQVAAELWDDVSLVLLETESPLCSRQEDGSFCCVCY